jgi:ABC-2 type transport system ATP-binding protein
MCRRIGMHDFCHAAVMMYGTTAHLAATPHSSHKSAASSVSGLSRAARLPAKSSHQETHMNMASSKAVAARGLAKTFTSARGPVHAVRNVDLSIAVGQTVALLGPNGAGKSTTIDLLLGLAHPDRGDARLFGMDPSAAIAAGQVAAMLQTGSLLRDLSVRELVAMMASLFPAPLPVSDVLDTAGLGAIADRRTQKLSGGQAQRVRFAIALVSDARLLVLDEPTVGMDVEARRELWTTIRAAAARGKTVMFATHNLEEAEAYADRIVVMARGEVVADGPVTEIKARVGARVIKMTLPDVDLGVLARLPGVSNAERRGDAVVLACSDSDRAIRRVLASFDQARDIEVVGSGLEDAFLELTGAAVRDAASESRRSA